MPEKDLINRLPEGIGIANILWILILATWGGSIRFFRSKLDSGGWHWRTAKFWWEYLLEVFSSIFVGLITFFMCTGAEFSPTLTAALVAVAGHEGGRVIQVYLRIAERKL